MDPLLASGVALARAIYGGILLYPNEEQGEEERANDAWWMREYRLRRNGRSLGSGHRADATTRPPFLRARVETAALGCPFYNSLSSCARLDSRGRLSLRGPPWS